jgi:hypothetical protein
VVFGCLIRSGSRGGQTQTPIVFFDHDTSWTVVSNGNFAVAPYTAANAFHGTDGGASEYALAWYNTPVNIDGFTVG